MFLWVLCAYGFFRRVIDCNYLNTISCIGIILHLLCCLNKARKKCVNLLKQVTSRNWHFKVRLLCRFSHQPLNYEFFRLLNLRVILISWIHNINAKNYVFSLRVWRTFPFRIYWAYHRWLKMWVSLYSQWWFYRTRLQNYLRIWGKSHKMLLRLRLRTTCSSKCL